jgi:hypothetical protein
MQNAELPHNVITVVIRRSLHSAVADFGTHSKTYSQDGNSRASHHPATFCHHYPSLLALLIALTEPLYYKKGKLSTVY